VDRLSRPARLSPPIAATNRPQELHEELLAPGRIDREVPHQPAHRRADGPSAFFGVHSRERNLAPSLHFSRGVPVVHPAHPSGAPGTAPGYAHGMPLVHQPGAPMEPMGFFPFFFSVCFLRASYERYRTVGLSGADTRRPRQRVPPSSRYAPPPCACAWLCTILYCMCTTVPSFDKVLFPPIAVYAPPTVPAPQYAQYWTVPAWATTVPS